MLSSLSEGFSKVGLSLFFASSVFWPHPSAASGKEAGPSDTVSTQSTRGPASVQQSSEKEVLREFVKIYKSSRTFKEFAIRTGSHRGLSSDYMSDVLGPAYLAPLPKISFDLEKLTVSFSPSVKGKGKNHSFKFISMKDGEVEFDGYRFTINPQLNGLENGILLAKRMQKKAAARNFESLFVPYADAQEVVKELNISRYESSKTTIGKIREWSVLGSLDGFGQVLTGYVGGAAGAALLGTGILSGMGIGMIATTLGHYGVKKLHAYSPFVPNCEAQAAEIAEKLRAMKAMLSGLSCENMFADPHMTFVDSKGSTRRLNANWERQDAYFEDSSTLYSFDRKKLKEVRYLGNRQTLYNKSTGTYEDGTYDVMSIKSGPKFDAHQVKIEPYRAILEIMGKYESCYRCEADFHRLLVKQYDPERDRKDFTLATYEELRGKSSPSSVKESSTEK